MHIAMLPFCGNQGTGKVDNIVTYLNFVLLWSKTSKLSCTPQSRELGHTKLQILGNGFQETLGFSELRIAFSVWNTSFATIYIQLLN